jgi:hypothetical protein
MQMSIKPMTVSPRRLGVTAYARDTVLDTVEFSGCKRPPTNRMRGLKKHLRCYFKPDGDQKPAPVTRELGWRHS